VKTLFFRSNQDQKIETAYDNILGPIDIQREGGIKHTFRDLFCKPQRPAQNVVSLLNLSLAVYAADKLFPRSDSEDAWTRDILISVPVTRSFKSTIPLLSGCVSFLSGDNWEIEMREEECSFEPKCYYKDNYDPTAVCLLSGGVDSLIGAINLLESGQRLILVGHHDFSVLANVQKKVFECLLRRYGLKNVRLEQIETKVLNAKETTTRARSLLFIALGLAVASSFGEKIPLYVSENGYIGINSPLTGGRIGSYSTRTTHPFYFQQLNTILKMTGIKHVLVNPIRHKSKGEVLKECRNFDLLKSIYDLTISCAHPTAGRWAGAAAGNCGYCFPCLIRRASSHTVGLDDSQKYTFDAIGSPQILRDGGLKAVDLQSILLMINRYINGKTKPVVEVLTSGPLCDDNEISRYASVFVKGSQEILELIKSKGCLEVKRYAGI
jgi:7-cyano-7-deazaguanine synthase in queuosine biosynthesis